MAGSSPNCSSCGGFPACSSIYQKWSKEGAVVNQQQGHVQRMRLHSCRPVRVPVLTSVHSWKHQKWAHEHQNWTTEQQKYMASKAVPSFSNANMFQDWFKEYNNMFKVEKLRGPTSQLPELKGSVARILLQIQHTFRAPVESMLQGCFGIKRGTCGLWS